jgi:hypothetical protein
MPPQTRMRLICNLLHPVLDSIWIVSGLNDRPLLNRTTPPRGSAWSHGGRNRALGGGTPPILSGGKSLFLISSSPSGPEHPPGARAASSSSVHEEGWLRFNPSDNRDDIWVVIKGQLTKIG